jgi:pantoate kinase
VPVRPGEAFAPAAISNFFTIPDDFPNSWDPKDYAKVGATGGGFVLSKGVYTRAMILNSSRAREVDLVVNGDPNYGAATTRTALKLLLRDYPDRFGNLRVEQLVQVPIGFGFGASGASALSGVLAVSAALQTGLPTAKAVSYAHVADIVSQTGLGTVSAISNLTGAGVITRAGSPEFARFMRVHVPSGFKIITASLAPYKKSRLFSSKTLSARVNRLGRIALDSVVEDPSLRNLLESGALFARKLGTETKDVKRLIGRVLDAGALGASQNMIGYAVHAVARGKAIRRVVESLRADQAAPKVEVFAFGRTHARVIESASVVYPTVTSSFV